MSAVAAPTPAPLALAVPTQHPAVVTVREKIATIVREAETVVVTTDEQKTAAVNVLSAIARAKADAERARLGFVEPLKKYTAGVDKLFRETLAPLLQVDQALRGKVTAFDAEQRRRAADAAAAEEAERLRSAALLREAEKAEATGDTTVAGALLEQAVTADTRATEAAQVAATPAPPKPFSTPFGAKATTRTVIDFEVTDAAAIPREYLLLDERKVRADIAAGVRDIAGLRIFPREALSVRA